MGENVFIEGESSQDQKLLNQISDEVIEKPSPQNASSDKNINTNGNLNPNPSSNFKF